MFIYIYIYIYISLKCVYIYIYFFEVYILLTFTCPCIANIIPNYNQQDAAFLDLFISTDALHISGVDVCHPSSIYSINKSYYVLYIQSGTTQVVVLFLTVCIIHNKIYLGFRRFLRPSSEEHNCTYSFRYCQPILHISNIG